MTRWAATSLLVVALLAPACDGTSAPNPLPLPDHRMPPPTSIRGGVVAGGTWEFPGGASGPSNSSGPPDGGVPAGPPRGWTSAPLVPARALYPIWIASPGHAWLGTPLMEFHDGQFTAAGIDEDVTSIHGLASNDVFAVTFRSRPYDAAIYHYDGTHWTLMSRFGGTPFEVYERTATDLFVATPLGLLRSHDQGRSFAQVPMAGSCGFETVSGDGSTIAAAGRCDTSSAIFFWSSDGGDTFAASALPDLEGLTTSTAGGTTYVSGYTYNPIKHQILRTSDGGYFVDVSPHDAIQPATAVGLAAVSSVEVWVADYANGSGIWHSTDGGTTWESEFRTTASVAGIRATPSEVFAVYVDETHDATAGVIHDER